MNDNKCKIAGKELPSNFKLSLRKREFFVIHFDEIDLATYRKFFKLKNWFVTCTIHHEKLHYSGNVSVREMSSNYDFSDLKDISIKIDFEA